MRLIKNPEIKTARDIYAEVTDKLIVMLEQNVVPWRAPFAAPKNPFTKHRYTGINVVVLFAEMGIQGWRTNMWGTEAQILKAGGSLKKGARPAGIVFYRPINDEATNDFFYVAKRYEVYNLDQTEGLDHLTIKAETGSPNPKVDKLSEFLKNCKAKQRLTIKGGPASYSFKTDTISIQLPSHYKTLEDYYAVLAHEHIHWTGAKKRLNRLPKKWTSECKEAYAREELIAELGAVFLGTEFEMGMNYPNHASYLDHWLQALKKDKREIFRAAAKASRATKYLKDLQPKQKSKAKLTPVRTG